jgi:hypothetical protein
MSDKAISNRIKPEDAQSNFGADREGCRDSNLLIDLDSRKINININENNSIISKYICSSAKNISTIFENFENISKNFDEKKGIINYLKDVRYNLSLFMGKFEFFHEEANQSITSVNQIISNFSLLYSPLKNIKSNLDLLRELFLSINLTNNNYGQNIKGFSSEESLKIDKIMTKVTAAIPLFIANIYNMEKHSGNLKKEIFDINEVLVQKIHRSLERAIYNIDGIIEYYNKNDISKSGYDNILKKCTKINNQIIAEFQSLNKYTSLPVDKISINGNGHSIDTNGKEVNGHDEIKKIPINNFENNSHNNYSKKSLIELSQRASDKLTEFGNSMFELNNLNKCLTGQKSPEDIDRVRNSKEGISDIISQISVYCTKEVYIKEEIRKIISVSKDLYDRFLDLDMMDNNLEQTIINKILVEEFLTNPEESIAKQAQQILKVYADNHFEKSSFKNVFESAIEELNSIKSFNEDNHKSFSYSLSFNELLEKLSKDFSCFKNTYAIIIEKSNNNGEVISKSISLSKDALKFCRNYE